jgi:hypothetical protein
MSGNAEGANRLDTADNGTPFTLILAVSGLCLAGFLVLLF